MSGSEDIQFITSVVPLLPGGKKHDFRTDSKKFAAQTKAISGGIRNLLKLASTVYALPSGGHYDIRGKKINRQFITSTAAQIIVDLDTLRKEFVATVGRRRVKPLTPQEQAKRAADAKKRGEQLKDLFYISDQLVEFFRNANFGNGLAQAFTAPAYKDQWDTLMTTPYASLQELTSATGLTGQQILAQWNAAESKLAEVERKKKPGRMAQQYTSADLSPVVQDAMDLVINKRMATAGILVSLMSLYYTANNLQSTVDGQRNRYDTTMTAYFGGYVSDQATYPGSRADTHYLLPARPTQPVSDANPLLDLTGNARAIADQEVEGTFKAKDKEAWEEKVNGIDDPAFNRLQNRPNSSVLRSSGGTSQYIDTPVFITQEDSKNPDNFGLLHTQTMVLTTYFRIPTALLTKEQKDLLQTKENRDAAAKLQNYIHGLLTAHRIRNADEKKAREEVRKAAKRAQAKTTSKRAARR